MSNVVRSEPSSASGVTPIAEEQCRVGQATIEFLGRRWMAAVLLAAARGATRFSEYRRAITGISDNLLAQRLRELQAQGMMTRRVEPTTPVAIRYEISPAGFDLIRALQPLLHVRLPH